MFLIFLYQFGILCAYTEGMIHQTIINDNACSTKSMVILASSGTLTSPIHVNAYPTSLLCTWEFLNPKRDFIILSFQNFELHEDALCVLTNSACCSHQYLGISTKNVLKRGSQLTSSKHSLQKQAKMHLLARDSDSNISTKVNGIVPHSNSLESDISRTTSPVGNESIHKLLLLSSLEQDHFHYFCGKDKPIPVITNSSYLVIKFFSDGKAKKGIGIFNINFYRYVKSTNCSSSEIRCKDPNYCIPAEWYCNSQQECLDNSDEEYCKDCRFGWSSKCRVCYRRKQSCYNAKGCELLHVNSEEVHCGMNEIECFNDIGFCYNKNTERCDGILNCPSGEDELGCDGDCHGLLSCSFSGGCYNSSSRCDGIADCGDLSDELCCIPSLCNSFNGGFLCANGKCIHDKFRCDQLDDCGDDSDEDDCLRNSVLVAAAMGGLICSLLLIIAMGCSCRLYALKFDTGNRRHGSGLLCSRESHRRFPLTRLEQYLLERELPPSYAVAISDPTMLIQGSLRTSQQWSGGGRYSSPVGTSLQSNDNFSSVSSPLLHHRVSGSETECSRELSKAINAKSDIEVAVFGIHNEDVPLLTDIGGDADSFNYDEDVPSLDFSEVGCLQQNCSEEFIEANAMVSTSVSDETSQTLNVTDDASNENLIIETVSSSFDSHTDFSHFAVNSN